METSLIFIKIAKLSYIYNVYDKMALPEKEG